MLLYTDGVVENTRDYVRGMKALTEALRAEARSAPNVAQAIQERVLAGAPAHDDAAMLFIGIDELGRQPVPQRYEWDFDARSEDASRRVKRAMLWRLPREAQSTAEIIFGELISNVARHTPGHARLSLESQDGEATLSVFDYGRPFEISSAAPDMLAESGRGLLIISAIARDFAVERTLHGNCVRATLALDAQPA